MRNEFTLGNPKAMKGFKRGFLTAILHFSPADGSGTNVCPYATPGCRVGCLNKAGHGGVMGVPRMGPTIQRARIARTRAWLADRHGYEEQLILELVRLKSYAESKDLTLVVRPNGTSDLPALAVNLAERLPDIQFYDYTKIPRPWRRQRENYHLTFSRSESNEVDCRQALANGISVAVVFDTKKGEPLPETFWDVPVVDGDDTDLRFLDPRGVVIGLRAKGPAKADQSGFVVKCDFDLSYFVMPAYPVHTLEVL